MIIVTRLNGSEIVINADLIEIVEAVPDTIVTLVDGTRYLVEESPRTIVERVKAFRAAVLRLGDDLIVDRASHDRTTSADIVALPTRTED